MRKNRVLAVIMAVLMMVTLLPSMVFAAAVPQGALDGKLKVKGTIAVGVTLSADYSKVKPEGITDDYVSFSWSLKDGDVLTEVGTDKTYKVEEKDLGFPIVLKITGKEEMGISGELTVTTQEVSATEEDAKALAQQKKTETSTSESGQMRLWSRILRTAPLRSPDWEKLIQIPEIPKRQRIRQKIRQRIHQIRQPDLMKKLLRPGKRKHRMVTVLQQKNLHIPQLYPQKTEVVF